ncbi:MAG: hypothetical protein D6677_06540 [Calditrichaeota bacterium]|nr:MAG: hypothetical protein D6677_06540 [Calditrichota bacterium]
METFTFRLSSGEAAILLRWHENRVRSATRYGGSQQIIFPQEEYLIARLRREEPLPEFDDMDLEMMLDWMDKALFPRPSSEAVYFPGEESLVSKLNQLRDMLTDFKKGKNRSRS